MVNIPILLGGFAPHPKQPWCSQSFQALPYNTTQQSSWKHAETPLHMVDVGMLLLWPEVQGARVRPYSRAPPNCHKSWHKYQESHRISLIDLHQSRTSTREPRIADSPTPDWQTRNAPWCCAWQPLPCSEPALAKGFGMLKDDNAGLDLNHATGTLLQNKSCCWDLRGESPT